MKNLRKAGAAVAVALLATAVPGVAGADPKPGTGGSDEPYSLGDCGGVTLVHVNHRSPVVHDEATSQVWVFKEVTYSDGTRTETFRIGDGIKDERFVTCTDSYRDGDTTINFTARLLPAGSGGGR